MDRLISPRMAISDSGRSPVVVTGLALTTALGADLDSTWNALLEGRCSAQALDGPLAGHQGHPLDRGGLLPGSDEPVLELLDRLADRLWDDARLSGAAGRRHHDPGRTACLVGLSKGGLVGLSRWADRPIAKRGLESSESRLDRYLPPWLDGWPHAGSSRVAARLDLRGPCSSPIAACATGLVAAMRGAAWISSGHCDRAVVGSADLSLEPLILGAFRSMRALAASRPDPRTTMRLWSRDRDGFLVGEGGALMLLERREVAESRGAPIRAEWLGGLEGADAHHITGLDPDPQTLADLIRRTIRAAGCGPEQVDLVDVHGTATPANDRLEASAVRLALETGRRDRSTGPWATAHKPQIGHLLGAAGSVELALMVLALQHGRIPPTINIGNDRDPECDLNGLDVGNPGPERPPRIALKLSLGFGGHLAVAVLGHPAIDRSRECPSSVGSRKPS